MQNKWARGLLVTLLCLLVYFFWRAAYTRMFLDEAYSYIGYTNDAELTAEGFSQRAAYGLSTVVRFKGVKTILYHPSDEYLSPGDKVSARVKIDETSGYFGGIHLKASCDAIEKVARPERTPVRYLASYLAESIRSKISAIVPQEQAALLRGMLTGDQSLFSAAVSSDFSATGLSHVAAVSGLNVSMLLGFVVLIAGNKRIAVWVGLPIIWIFVAVTGLSPSAVRAGIMITMTLLAPLLGREYNALTALCSALVVLLLVDPYSIQDIGLQMSFLSTLGLILFSGKLQRTILNAMPVIIPGNISRALASTLAATLSALMFTTPLVAYWFGCVSVIAPLSNLLLLWIVNVIFITGVLALLAAFIWLPAGEIVAWAPRLLLEVFEWAMELFAKIPYSRIYMTRPILVAWLVFIYAIVLLMIFGLPKARGIALSAAMLAVCIALDMFHSSMFGLEITVLNVGQGQCVVMRSRGKTAVVDCGGNLGDAGNVAADYLESVGARRVDALILTHLHTDHTNGVKTLTDRIDVKEIYLPEYGVEGESEFELKYTPVSAELSLEFGEAKLMLIPSLWMGADNELCMSVFCLKDQFSFITTGDLSASAERWLRRWMEIPVGGILLAGHHGSARSLSDEFLSSVGPQAAIISVGKNTFGHPSPEVLERLGAYGCQVYRTDRDGHIIISVP